LVGGKASRRESGKEGGGFAFKREREAVARLDIEENWGNLLNNNNSQFPKWRAAMIKKGYSKRILG